MLIFYHAKKKHTFTCFRWSFLLVYKSWRLYHLNFKDIRWRRRGLNSQYKVNIIIYLFDWCFHPILCSLPVSDIFLLMDSTIIKNFKLHLSIFLILFSSLHRENLRDRSIFSTEGWGKNWSNAQKMKITQKQNSKQH